MKGKIPIKLKIKNYNIFCKLNGTHEWNRNSVLKNDLPIIENEDSLKVVLWLCLKSNIYYFKAFTTERRPL